MDYKDILLIEDDPHLCEAIQETLRLENYSFISCPTYNEALQKISMYNFGLIITDMNLPGEHTGLDIIRRMHILNFKTPFVVITAYGSINNAIESTKYGAKDYILKPFEVDYFLKIVKKNILASSENKMIYLPQSEEMINIVENFNKVAKTDTTVLILGESGTGKEVYARYVHDNSSRKNEPFIPINCAAIPENMLEALLFGFEKGVFTGAYQSTPGKFEHANNGTIFLDEISEMPLNLQSKILRVIQEKEVERLGAKKSTLLNVRIVCATNKNLREEVKNNHFREDLFYRINVFPIHLLPLRNRKDDLEGLANFLLNKILTRNKLPSKNLSDNALKKLKYYHWPGNIRELENILERATVLTDSDNINEENIVFEEMDKVSQDRTSLKENEFDIIFKILKDNKGSRAKTANILEISQRTLRYKLAKMKDLGFDIPKIQHKEGLNED